MDRINFLANFPVLLVINDVLHHLKIFPENDEAVIEMVLIMMMIVVVVAVVVVVVVVVEFVLMDLVNVIVVLILLVHNIQFLLDPGSKGK